LQNARGGFLGLGLSLNASSPLVYYILFLLKKSRKFSAGPIRLSKKEKKRRGRERERDQIDIMHRSSRKLASFTAVAAGLEKRGSCFAEPEG
jgi:hypothetical protein